MCLDHPDKVIKAAIIDIVPTLDMWAAMDKDGAIGGWHWPFMAQPADFPERMLGSVPADWFMRKKLLKLTADLNHIPPAIWDEYVRCFNEKTIRGSCADYRAAATIDCELDTADLGRKLKMPILVLWGKTSSVGKRFADPLGAMAAARRRRPRRSAAERALCERGGTGAGAGLVPAVLRRVKPATTRATSERDAHPAEASDRRRRAVGCVGWSHPGACAMNTELVGENVPNV